MLTDSCLVLQSQGKPWATLSKPSSSLSKTARVCLRSNAWRKMKAAQFMTVHIMVQRLEKDRILQLVKTRHSQRQRPIEVTDKKAVLAGNTGNFDLDNYEVFSLA